MRGLAVQRQSLAVEAGGDNVRPRGTSGARPADDRALWLPKRIGRHEAEYKCEQPTMKAPVWAGQTLFGQSQRRRWIAVDKERVADQVDGQIRTLIPRAADHGVGEFSRQDRCDEGKQAFGPQLALRHLASEKNVDRVGRAALQLMPKDVADQAN